MILDDATLDDVTTYGMPRPAYSLSLAFLADFDGTVDDFLSDHVKRADDGLRQILAAIELVRGKQMLSPRCFTGMPRLISVRGGAYFFLPGKRALRYIASR